MEALNYFCTWIKFYISTFNQQSFLQSILDSYYYPSDPACNISMIIAAVLLAIDLPSGATLGLVSLILKSAKLPLLLQCLIYYVHNRNIIQSKEILPFSTEFFLAIQYQSFKFRSLCIIKITAHNDTQLTCSRSGTGNS